MFSTEGDRQSETIGAFWDELSKEYGRESLRGLGYNWTSDTIEYVIGMKYGDIDNANCSVILPVYRDADSTFYRKINAA